MFRRPETIQPDTHGALRFSRNQPYDFAREAMLLPLAGSELNLVAREMPIVFPMHRGVPQALVGLQEGHNLHVELSGHWKGRYVPACLQAYPFRLAEVGTADEEGRQQFVVQIDRDARHFQTDEGEPLLNDDGSPGPLLEKAQQALMQLRQDSVRAEKRVAVLDRHGLLQAQHILIHKGSDDERALTGFRVVNDKALAELSGEALVELRDTGVLAMIHAHRISLTNLKDGLLAQASRSRKAKTDLGTLFDSDDDITFDFDS